MRGGGGWRRGRWLLALLLAPALLPAACAEPLPPREQGPLITPEAGWPVLAPGVRLGQPSAVALDSHGHLFVLHRAGRAWAEPFPTDPIAAPTVLMLDAEDGRLLAQWGAGQFVMPHGLSVDAQDRVWITDVAREQVLRFSHDGAPQLALGTRGVSGEDGAHFGRPADVGFAGGRVLVADGYVNSRVAVFSPEGRFAGQWGGAGAEPGQFAVPHSVAARGGTVFVADRENGRVQLFYERGGLKAVWRGTGRGNPYGLVPLEDGGLLAIEGRDRFGRPGAWLRRFGPDGQVRASYTLPPAAPDRELLGHDLASGADGSFYAVDTSGDRVIKFRLPDRAGAKRSGKRR